MSVLGEDEFARNYQLANKLQKVHLLMRVRVWCRQLDRTSGLLKDLTVLSTAAAWMLRLWPPKLLFVCRGDGKYCSGHNCATPIALTSLTAAATGLACRNGRGRRQAHNYMKARGGSWLLILWPTWKIYMLKIWSDNAVFSCLRLSIVYLHPHEQQCSDNHICVH